MQVDPVNYRQLPRMVLFTSSVTLLLTFCLVSPGRVPRAEPEPEPEPELPYSLLQTSPTYVVELVEANGSGVRGTINLRKTGGAVELWGQVGHLAITWLLLSVSQVQNLDKPDSRPGLHGFHIHEKGDLGNNCVDAGGHFNPDQVLLQLHLLLPTLG